MAPLPLVLVLVEEESVPVAVPDAPDEALDEVAFEVELAVAIARARNFSKVLPSVGALIAMTIP